MTTDELAIDAVFDALADDVRRELLAHLREVGAENVEELVSTIGRRADGIRSGTHGTDLAVRLHHVHLPKLADADLVEYDRGAGRVEYVGGSAIDDLLATAPRETVAD